MYRLRIMTTTDLPYYLFTARFTGRYLPYDPQQLQMPSTHDEADGGGCGWRWWIGVTILFNGFFILFTSLPPIYAIENPDDLPTTCAVELAAFEGLQPALSPGATSPSFDLILRVTNGHTFYLSHEGSDLVVSYAGVPLARGRTPSFVLADKEVSALPVKATSAGIGVPGDLLRLMTEERRLGVVQVHVEFGLTWEKFVCDVQLDAQLPGVSRCYKITTGVQ
ncbi:hypothetical protein BS78_03G156500 [Paspalum vaginatum]|nr:hypothetical protein BS78_03G156500 [Paspalum vaginatum]